MSATIASLLTPPGRSALATVGVRGSRSWEIVQGLFLTRAGSPLPSSPDGGRFWLGRIGADIADDGILAVRRAGVSPCVELHLHGGREVARLLLDLLVARGVEVVSWERFVAAEEEVHRAEATLALARARTTRTAAILLDQYHGALHRDLYRVEELLRGGEASSINDILLSLERRYELGRHLTEPFGVVIAGAPNVGKSSLVNALAGYQRAIVSPIPGTTRDAVATLLAIDGWPVELIDTAGLRDGGESLEQAGIDQARLAAAGADLVLWLVDGSAAPEWPAAQPDNLRVVVNKCDLPPAWDVALAGDAPRVAATTGEGVAALCDSISRWLVPDVPPPGAAVPFTEAQVDEIRLLRRRACSVAAPGTTS